MTREIFQPDLNVHRQGMVDAILDWLRQPYPEFRLRSIVGTAGIGKSWFMSDLLRELSEDAEFHIIWLDFSRKAVHPLNREDLPDCLQENGRLAWMSNIIEASNLQYDRKIFTLHPDVNFIPAFRAFVQAIGRQNPPISILLVDGYDEIPSASDQDYVQEQILSRFWGGNNTRILLARRDEDLISHPILSWNDDPIRLPSFANDESQEQVLLRAQINAPDGIDIDQIPKVFSPFLTGNPFINAFLFDCFIENTPPTISDTHIDACLMAVMDRARLSAEHIHLVKEIVKSLPAEWTAKELSERLNIRLEDKNLAALFEAGIVHQISGTANYQIEAGLYRLLS